MNKVRYYYYCVPGVANKLFPPTVQTLITEWADLWPAEVLEQAAVLLTEPEPFADDAGCGCVVS